MDKNKKEKLVAILLTTLASLAVSTVACIFGVSPQELAGDVSAAETATVISVCECAE